MPCRDYWSTGWIDRIRNYLQTRHCCSPQWRAATGWTGYLACLTLDEAREFAREDCKGQGPQFLAKRPCAVSQSLDTGRITDAATELRGPAGDKLSNDAANDRLSDVMTRLHDQLGDIAAMQKKQAALKVSARTADGTVEVTVNARGQLVAAVIDRSYLDDHEFDDLAGHITEAAQTAARDAAQRVAEMLAPINKRQRSFPSLSDIVDGMPDPSDLMPPGLDAWSTAPQRRPGSAVSSAGRGYDEGDGEVEFPTVRR